MGRKTATIAGVSTLLMAGAAYFTWRKSEKYRLKYLENFAAWKKGKIETMYYNNIDERDIAWG